MAKARDEYELVADAKTGGLETGVERIKKKFGELGESQNKQKRHMLGFVQDMASARSATDVLNAGIMRLSESFKVGLLGGVAAGLGSMLKASTDEITKRFDELGEAQVDLTKDAAKSDVAKPIEKLKAEAAAASEQAKKLRASLKDLRGDDSPLGINRHFFAAGAQHIAEMAAGGAYTSSYRGLGGQLESSAKMAEDREGELNREIIRREEAAAMAGRIAIDDATGPKSSRKTAYIEGERLRLAKEELDIAKKASVRDDADIQKKTLTLRLQEQRSKEAEAEDRAVEHKLNIEEQSVAVRLSAEGTMEKQYRLAKLTAEAAHEEALAMKSKNTDQAAFLALKEKEAKAVAANIDQQLNKGKSGKEVRDRIRDQEKEQKEVEKFRARREKDKGLIPTKRGLDGQVEEGIDPVTGEKKAVDANGNIIERGGADEERKRLWDRAKKRAKNDGKGVAQELNKNAEANAAAAEAKKIDPKAADPGKETVQELKGLRQDIKGIVAKR